MRIVAGIHRGRRITVSPGLDVRPTADRVRESVFNILEHGGLIPGGGSALPGARVLDAFCGTGALAFEALSRGADSATLIDVADKALADARATARAIGEEPRVRLVRRDATAPGPAPARHDLVFLDPPYGSGLALPALAAFEAGGWLAPAALAVVELAAREEAPPLPPAAELLRERRYGAAQILFLRWRVSAAPEQPLDVGEA